jgi:hypothetical protein
VELVNPVKYVAVCGTCSGFIGGTYRKTGVGIAQLVSRLVTGWKAGVRMPAGVRCFFFPQRPDRPPIR